jgi:hypothetical protein
MSLATLQDYLFRLKSDPQMQAGLAADPRAHAREQKGLSAEECEAVGGIDIAALYRLGAHPLLITPFSRFAGISATEYKRIMAPLAGSRPFRSEPR